MKLPFGVTAASAVALVLLIASCSTYDPGYDHAAEQFSVESGLPSDLSVIPDSSVSARINDEGELQIITLGSSSNPLVITGLSSSGQTLQPVLSNNPDQPSTMDLQPTTSTVHELPGTVSSDDDITIAIEGYEEVTIVAGSTNLVVITPNDVDSVGNGSDNSGVTVQTGDIDPALGEPPAEEFGATGVGIDADGTVYLVTFGSSSNPTVIESASVDGSTISLESGPLHGPNTPATADFVPTTSSLPWPESPIPDGERTIILDRVEVLTVPESGGVGWISVEEPE